MKILIYLPERCSQGDVRRRWDFAELLHYDLTGGYERDFLRASAMFLLPIGRNFPMILTLKTEAELTGIIVVFIAVDESWITGNEVASPRVSSTCH